jgi:hypothetical protein
LLGEAHSVPTGLTRRFLFRLPGHGDQTLVMVGHSRQES